MKAEITLHHPLTERLLGKIFLIGFLIIVACFCFAFYASAHAEDGDRTVNLKEQASQIQEGSTIQVSKAGPRSTIASKETDQRFRPGE